MKKVILIISVILLSGIFSHLFFQLNIGSNVYFLLISLYWIIGGVLYFRNIETKVYLPFIILTIYTFLNMFLQIRYAKIEDIIKMHELVIWTNFGFLPLLKVFYTPEHSMEVYTYKIYGVIFFITINLLFYLGYILVKINKSKPK